MMSHNDGNNTAKNIFSPHYFGYITAATLLLLKPGINVEKHQLNRSLHLVSKVLCIVFSY